VHLCVRSHNSQCLIRISVDNNTAIGHERLSVEIWVIYLLLGALAGVLAGLLGVGGGLIIVPVLFGLFTEAGFDSALTMHMAIATSLATIIVTAIASTMAHHRHQAVIWSVFWKLLPGILIGSIAGAIFASDLPGNLLIVCFALFEIFVAWQMWFAVKPETSGSLPGAPGMFLAGGTIGSVSAIIGIGGGTLTVPFLVWCNRGVHKAVATSSACGLPIALASAVSYLLLGLDEPNLPTRSAGYIYLPAFLSISLMSLLFAPLGAKLAHRLPVMALKKIFAILLILIGVKMLLVVI